MSIGILVERIFWQKEELAVYTKDLVMCASISAMGNVFLEKDKEKAQLKRLQGEAVLFQGEAILQESQEDF